jgi:glycosyltransferase involved in cell wall biosynthesis
MIRLFMNGLAASAGGGLTYLRNVIPELARRTDAETTVFLSPTIRSEFSESPNVHFVADSGPSGSARRFIHEQMAIPRLVKSSGAQVLVSTGNFALWKSPVPQILLSRNSLYTSTDFRRDLRARGDRAILADTFVKGWLARRSIGRAEVTVAPSMAFAQELNQWSGNKYNVRAIHHGFDLVGFASDSTPLPTSAQTQLDQGKDALRLLFVSHYNYYRNFETLFRAIPILTDRLQGRRVKLFLTCRLDSKANPGTYSTKSAASLVDDLRGADSIVELGTIPYRSLHHLYRACNIYVTPAYAESFAHPLIEAMSSGLPIVASDLPVHREICGDAAIYFPHSSPEALAERVLEIQNSPQLAEMLASNGLRRSRDFSWSQHVQQLIDLALDLVRLENARKSERS